MRRRWKALIATGATLLALAVMPIAYVEIGCRTPPEGWQAAAPYKSALPSDAGKRPEARTWLTYPEWYIVYSADSYGRYLAAGNAPSGFSYWRQITGFWNGLCAVNRVSQGDAGDAKLMLYTIGLSFSAEMAIKGVYENVFGRIAEWIGGWKSENDRYSAAVWQRYGAFMHETPWYKFGFSDAMRGLWGTNSAASPYRNWERRLALSAEFGIKSLYGSAIGVASDAALGPAQETVPLVLREGGGLRTVEAPRYAKLTAMIVGMAGSGTEIVEIAGNDDVLMTVIAPENAAAPAGSYTLFTEKLDDRPGWQRLGLAVKVPALLPAIGTAKAAGIEIEHIYDY